MLSHRPRLWALLTWMLTLVIGGTLLLMADFGTPWWSFVPGLLFLATLGLPAFATIQILALCWHPPELLSGPLWFALIAALLSFVVQQISYVWMAKRVRQACS